MEGKIVFSVDNNTYDTQYWIKSFLNIVYPDDSNQHTKNCIELCREFSKEVLQPNFGGQELWPKAFGPKGPSPTSEFGNDAVHSTRIPAVQKLCRKSTVAVRGGNFRVPLFLVPLLATPTVVVWGPTLPLFLRRPRFRGMIRGPRISGPVLLFPKKIWVIECEPRKLVLSKGNRGLQHYPLLPLRRPRSKPWPQRSVDTLSSV